MPSRGRVIPCAAIVLAVGMHGGAASAYDPYTKKNSAVSSGSSTGRPWQYVETHPVHNVLWRAFDRLGRFLTRRPRATQRTRQRIYGDARYADIAIGRDESADSFRKRLQQEGYDFAVVSNFHVAGLKDHLTSIAKNEGWRSRPTVWLYVRKAGEVPYGLAGYGARGARPLPAVIYEASLVDDKIYIRDLKSNGEGKNVSHEDLEKAMLVGVLRVR